MSAKELDRVGGGGAGAPSDHPLLRLEREDLDMITNLVLCNSSLKDLAASYGVSYPTIRARFDKVIERLRAAVEERPRDPMSELLARLVERGELSVGAARSIRELSRKLQETD